MKFTLSWLKDHLETTASLAEITDKLTALGLEVEGIEDRAATFAPFKVAYVESAEKHPDADRLRVCMVDTGTEKLQVVCGAPNARAGMKAVFAPAGSVIPGTGDTLKKGVIRGQESNGMLVSEREMGLSDEHNGIIDVAADVPVGTPFAALYGVDDPVIDINLTPNRADCAGVRGIARDLAAAEVGTLKPLNDTPVSGVFASPVGVSLSFANDAANACPHFVGRVIRGVRNGPSPDWLQRRLKAIGLRPISALVDVTNYLNLGLCRPLHVFDAAKLRGNLIVRLAKDGEMLAALDGKDYALDASMTVVADDSGPLGLGGIMGGAASGCSDATTDVFIEAAYFDPLRTARTGRALQINSDARYRFERGVDPAFTVSGLEVATRLILELCGGEASIVVTAGTPQETKRTIAYNPAYFEKLIGMTLPAARQQDILVKLGFVVDGNAVVPPSWRGDIEGRVDLAEEIARVNGFDAIPATSLTKPGAVTMSGERGNMARLRRVRGALAAGGLDECVTWSFLKPDIAEKFGANDHQAARSLRLVNPISADLSQMRPSLLPNLIEAASRNAARGYGDIALFEIGPVFRTAQIKGQEAAAAGVRHGRIAPRHWSGADISRAPDAFDAKADALTALEAAGVNPAGVQIARGAPDWFHPGQSGMLRMGNVVAGHFGALHPALLDEFGIRAPLCGFELFLSRLPAPKEKTGAQKPLLVLPVFQPIERDFAFIVAETVEADSLIRAARGVDRTLLTRVDIFDVYAGAGVAPGHKSVGLAVTIQPVDKTLTDAEIEALAARIVQAVQAKTGAVLRG